MYTDFFHLSAKPFQLTPDPDFLFMSKVHKRALTYLNYGITENAGFILVTGEVGTGKTTLIRSILKTLGDDVMIAKITNTRVTSEQLIAMINEDFGLSTQDRDKTRMISELTDFLIQEYARGSRLLLIIDEAQNLSPDLLEEIRLLSNLETDKAKLLQIILVGQPELRKTLALPELRQLRQRISMSCHINPLTRQESEDYIMHRLEKAGNRAAVVFQEGVIDSIYRFSRGVPRLINICCDFLMLAAFAEETREITAELIADVIGDLENENRYWQDEAQEPRQAVQTLPDQGMLREIVNRLLILEEETQRNSIGPASRTELLDRLSAAEEMLESGLRRIREELARNDRSMLEKQIVGIQRELDALRQRMTDMEAKIAPAPEEMNSRKSFWGRLFSSN